MKHLVAVGFFMCILIFGSKAQDTIYDMPMDPITNLITYQEVVEQQGTKDELFNRGSTWLRIFYANPMAVSEVRDQSTGLIRGSHQIKVYHTDEAGVKQEGGIILYSFKIEFKDGRYRFTVDNFLVKKVSRYPLERWMNPMDPEYTSLWNEYLKQVDTFVREEWIPSLKTNMYPEVKKEEKEW
jgi:hypothetical protein